MAQNTYGGLLSLAVNNGADANIRLRCHRKPGDHTRLREKTKTPPAAQRGSMKRVTRLKRSMKVIRSLTSPA